MNRIMSTSAVLALLGTVAAIAWASDPSCTPTYPICPVPPPEENHVCSGSGDLYDEVSGPIPMWMYTCNGHNSKCDPPNVVCNELVRWDVTGYTFRCGPTGELVFCVSSGLGSSHYLNVNCSNQICDHTKPYDGPGATLPPCTDCAQGVLPEPAVPPDQ